MQTESVGNLIIWTSMRKKLEFFSRDPLISFLKELRGEKSDINELR